MCRSQRMRLTDITAGWKSKPRAEWVAYIHLHMRFEVSQFAFCAKMEHRRQDSRILTCHLDSGIDDLFSMK